MEECVDALMDKAGDPSARAQAWLASYSRSSRWLEKWDLPRLLDEHGGLVKIPAFFPDHVAEEALRIVAAIPARLWVPTEAEHDAAANNIRHSFASTKRSGPGLDALFRVLTLLLPGQLHALSAARYAAADGIAPHDDRAFTPVQMDSGAVVSCSRDVAVIYYLTKGWEERMGGVLVDLETGARYVPEFNSLVAFRVPRMHEVTPVAAPRPRYSLFGWFLQPGELYELGGGAKAEIMRTKDTRKRRKRRKEEADTPAHPCKLAQRILARAAREAAREKLAGAGV